jgi:recombination protein RecA
MEIISKLEKALKEFKVPVNTISGDTYTPIPTGFYAFDNEIMKSGGFPTGRVIEVYGPPGSCKSLLALRIIAMAQRLFPDKAAGIIDTEFAHDRKWIAMQGIDPERMLFVADNVAENVHYTLCRYVETGLCSVVVLDSLGNLQSSKMANTSEWFKVDKQGNVASSSEMGLSAVLTTAFMKKITNAAAKTNTCVIICNQVRDKIGVLYGSPETTPGGNALGHDVAMRIRMSKVEDIVDDRKNVIGHVASAHVKRNKVAVNGVGRTDDGTHLSFYFEDGIKKTEVFSTYDEAVKRGIISKAGAWVYWNYGGEQIKRWQGNHNAREHFLTAPDDLAKLKDHNANTTIDATFSSEPETVSVTVVDE